MADSEKGKSKGDKAKGGDKPKPAKKPESAAKPEKAAKAKATEKVADAPEEKPAPKAAPRPPADPRAKVWKKFQGRFLPRGPLRDRYQALAVRWNSDDNHGGVTVDELKTLLTDWRASRKKRAKVTA